MRTAASLAALLAVLPAAARAEGGGFDAMRAACGPDAERLCSGSPNPGMCLHEHWDELSPECRAFKEGMKKRWQDKRGKKHAGHEAFKNACGADVEKHCAGDPNVAACLRENMERLSPECRAFKEGKLAELGKPRKKPLPKKARFEWADKEKAEPKGLEPVEETASVDPDQPAPPKVTETMPAD